MNEGSNNNNFKPQVFNDDSVAFIDLFNFKTQPCKLAY